MATKTLPPLSILESARALPTVLHPRDTSTWAGKFVERLLSLLPISSLLSLRQVSHATKAMVDSRQPPVVSSPYMTFPLNQLSPSHLSKLHCTAPYDDVLSVYFSEAPATIPSASHVPLPPYPSLIHLRVNCPSEDPFYPLLNFRLALQAADIPILTHLTLFNVSLDSILALRWGSLTSFGESDWHSGRVWRGIKHLDITLLPPRLDGSPRSHEVSTNEKERRREEQQEWRTGIKILHDWLNSFASTGASTASGLATLKFEWKNYVGPNPLLLDLGAEGATENPCTSAPAIMWNRLKEVWLRGVQITQKDIQNIKQRAPKLKVLMVQPELLKNETLGWPKEIDGYKWWSVYLGKQESSAHRDDDGVVLSDVDEGAEGAPESSRRGEEAGEAGVPLSKQVSASSMDVTIMLGLPFHGMM